MQITEIYADDAGETHLRDTQVNFEPRDFAPPSAPMEVSPETSLTSGVFLELPPGTTDGAAADFRRGDLFLLNDKDSKGHLSLVQGQESVTLFLIGLANSLN